LSESEWDAQHGLHLFGQFVDLRVQPALADAGANQAAFLAFAKQSLSVTLRDAKFCNSLLFKSVYRKDGV
jgi:hypothetical protein